MSYPACLLFDNLFERAGLQFQRSQNDFQVVVFCFESCGHKAGNKTINYIELLTCDNAGVVTLVKPFFEVFEKFAYLSNIIPVHKRQYISKARTTQRQNRQREPGIEVL